MGSADVGSHQVADGWRRLNINGKPETTTNQFTRVP